MDYSKLKLYITSTTLTLGLAVLTYLFIRHKRRIRDAKDIFNYLNINIITEEFQCENVVSELRRRCQKHKAIGFDCEWVTNNGKRQPVALMQLSTFDGYCGLFRLSHIKSVPESLKDLLAEKSIYKVGVAPLDDAQYLFSDHSVTLNSTLDIRHLAHLCGYESGGLASLSKSLLKVLLDKSWRVRCSDWEAESLSEAQIRYAAVDAHVAIKIFVKLIDHLNGRQMWYFFRRKENLWDELDGLCSPYADVHFSVKITNADKQIKKKNGSVKESKKKYVAAIRSKPLYHNCFLEAPDGELLCTCDNKKALWYVEKELADVVRHDPLTVRLRFEPAGRSVGDVGRYYQLAKENKCVVCGKTNSYIRKNVVPREYRKYFPEVMKDHSSHDVVLLCLTCHQRSNASDAGVRARLAARCRAPFQTKGCSKYSEDQICKKIRSAARALLYQSQKHSLPEARRRELELVLLEHYPHCDEVTEHLLREAANVQVLVENAEYESHGQKVVEYFSEAGGGLLRLERLWREHFLQAMRPKYMPELWSVTHNEERLLVRLKEGRLSEQDMKLVGL